MTENGKVQDVVLGSGEPGKYMAWELARQGRRTIVVERALIGGSCPNIACLPSKNVIRSAKVAQFVRHAAEYGQRTGPVTTDMASVRRRKRQMVEGLIEIHRQRFAANGLEFVLGEGCFVAPGRLKCAWYQEANDGSRRTACSSTSARTQAFRIFRAWSILLR